MLLTTNLQVEETQQCSVGNRRSDWFSHCLLNNQIIRPWTELHLKRSAAFACLSVNSTIFDILTHLAIADALLADSVR